MSLEHTQQVLDGYLDALVGGRDFERFFTEDVVWTTLETGEEVRGRIAVREYIVNLHTKMFDAKPELKTLFIAEHGATLEADFVGTHTGDFAGIPATGASVRMPYCVVYDVTDDRIAALRAYIPVAAMIAQLQAAAS